MWTKTFWQWLPVILTAVLDHIEIGRFIVRLSADRNMNVEEKQVFNLPLRSEFAMEVGAVSLILDLPSDFAQVMDVKVNGSNVPAAGM